MTLEMALMPIHSSICRIPATMEHETEYRAGNYALSPHLQHSP